MTTIQEKRLARLTNYRTRYELAAIHPDGRRMLIAYSMRKGRRSIYSILTERERSVAVCALTGRNAIDWGKRAADGGTMGEWSVRFTGRTQRDAILGGELPFVLDVPKVEVQA